MTEKEMALLAHYNLRNHIGAMVLKDDRYSYIYRKLYNKIKKTVSKGHILVIERRLNNKLHREGRLHLMDIYDELGIDTSFYRWKIENGLAPELDHEWEAK